MKTFEFEVWTFSKEQLPVLWEFMFQDLGFIEQFKINRVFYFILFFLDLLYLLGHSS